MARPPALLQLAAQQPHLARTATVVPLARKPSPAHHSARSFSSSATASVRADARENGARSWFGATWTKRDSRKQLGAQRAFHSSPVALAKNPYSVLGVSKDAKASDIKKNYYQLAKKYHPDSSKEKDAKERFVEIQEAYDILSDEKKRADFDRFGDAARQPGFDSDAYARATSSFGGAGFGDFFGGGAGGPSGADIFDSLFGAFGRGGSAGPGQTVPVGDDIEISVSVPFIDAAKGATRTVAISPVVDCHTCHGSGLKEGMKKTQCASCGGTGTRTFTIQSGFQMASTCATCGGSGHVAPPGSNCGTCAGVGKVRERQTVEVKIPPGVDDGMRIRMDGKGDAPLGAAASGIKGRNGDLYVRINVQPSKVFTRQGSNLYQTVSVPFYTAILGGRAPVKTLDRDVEVRVPQGTQPGEEMVMRGRGVKKLYKEEYGDLVVKFNVTMPRTLTPAQKFILQQFVAETELPGSTMHYRDSTSSAPPPRPSSSSSSPSADSSASTAPPQKPTVDNQSPGFTQQAKPPPSEPVSKASWWTTMSDDITSSPKPSSSSPTPSTSSAKPSSSSSPASSSASASTPPPSQPESKPAPAPAEAQKDKKDDEHVSLKDLWKGARRLFGFGGSEEGGKDGGGKKK